MFTIPDEHVTQVAKDERFTVVKMGHGKASLCGKKVVLIIPSEGRRLGERFVATGNNKLIPETPISKFRPHSTPTGKPPGFNEAIKSLFNAF